MPGNGLMKDFGLASFTTSSISRSYCQVKGCGCEHYGWVLSFTPGNPKSVLCWLCYCERQREPISKMMNLQLHRMKGKEHRVQLHLTGELCGFWFFN